MELSRVRSRWRFSVLCLIACLAVAEFSARGPIRALRSNHNFNDFSSPYAQTRTWLSGRDPYAASTVRELWPALPSPTFLLKESTDGTLTAKHGVPSPYMTTAFPLLLPIAELPWRIAIWVWVLMCVSAVFVAASTLIDLAGVRKRSQLALMIFVSVLLFAPVHTAIAAANIVTVAFALGVVAMFCLMRDRAGMAGALLTLAVALKPTAALPFVIFALVSGKRAQVIVPAIATGIPLLSVAVIPTHGGTLWWKSFLANDQSMFAPGAIDDFSTANPLHFQLVNLQAALFPVLHSVLHSMSHSRALTQFGAMLVFVVLLAFWLRAVRRDRQIGLLDLSILASAALLPVYHRFTDAGLLLVPVVWALSEMEGELRRYAAGCLLLASPFLVPGATILHEFSERSAILHSLSLSRWWDCFILPHESWLILMLCVVFLKVRSLPPGNQTVQSGRAPQPSIAV
jgi:hypothetical protein